MLIFGFLQCLLPPPALSFSLCSLLRCHVGALTRECCMRGESRTCQLITCAAISVSLHRIYILYMYTQTERPHRHSSLVPTSEPRARHVKCLDFWLDMNPISILCVARTANVATRIRTTNKARRRQVVIMCFRKWKTDLLPIPKLNDIVFLLLRGERFIVSDSRFGLSKELQLMRKIW